MKPILNVNGTEYELYLSAGRAIELESQLGGKNPVAIFAGTFPPLTDVLRLLHYSLPVEKGKKPNFNDTVAIYDEYISAGNTSFDLIALLMEVLREAGFLHREKEMETNE